ncbi:unnamed protein product [Adineta steineri]|uniref:Uncharacterized protein n=2 Tax=Adineta steineri TaxID=433720 RepID=A0A818XDU0_9BILA|nr:unnamed protein product [Adineta steineri]CAF3664033.1 unnamed protein product [Adineta steineri]CAF3735631.1 unnamed protein product [Adineta steineri]
MNAVIALIFFACVAGSMATDARVDIMDLLVSQGQGILQSTMTMLQSQLMNIATQALGQLTGLIANLGGRLDFNINAILEQFKPLLVQAASGLLGQLTGLLGGRMFGDLQTMFTDFLGQITTSLLAIGQSLLNQGLSAVIGQLAGSRFLGDFMSQITSQFASAIATAQGVVSSTVASLTGVASSLLDASKPHLADLQKQLMGHGLNMLGSISETVNNLHGSLIGSQ